MNTEAISQSQRFSISGYLKLTKPSIIYLLVLTAATAMFLADGFAGELSKIVFGLLGIALILLGVLKYPDYAIGFSVVGVGFIAIGWAFNALKGRV